jgi:hypothetical protein
MDMAALLSGRYLRQFHQVTGKVNPAWSLPNEAGPFALAEKRNRERNA